MMVHPFHFVSVEVVSPGRLGRIPLRALYLPGGCRSLQPLSQRDEGVRLD